MLPGGFLGEEGLRFAVAVFGLQVEQDRREGRRFPEAEAVDVVAGEQIEPVGEPLVQRSLRLPAA